MSLRSSSSRVFRLLLGGRYVVCFVECISSRGSETSFRSPIRIVGKFGFMLFERKSKVMSFSKARLGCR